LVAKKSSKLLTIRAIEFLFLKIQNRLDCFVCADEKLGKVTKLEKITFLNPESP